MIYTVKLLSMNPDIEEKCNISIEPCRIGFEPVALTCFASHAPTELYCGEHYQVEIMPFICDDYIVHQVDDAVQPSLKRIGEGFSYEVFGRLEENTVFSSIPFEDDYFGLHFWHFNGKMIRWKVDRLDMSFITLLPRPLTNAHRNGKYGVEVRQGEIVSSLHVTPFEVLANEGLLTWRIVAVGYKRGWCEKSEVIQYAEKYVESLSGDIPSPVIEIVTGEQLSDMRFKRLLEDMFGLNDDFRDMESLLLRWRYAILLSIMKSSSNEDDIVSLVWDTYVEFIYPEDMTILNAYGDSRIDLLEGMKSLINELRDKIIRENRGSRVSRPLSIILPSLKRGCHEKSV